MRVALITDGIWPFVIGGMQRHSYYLCKYLAINKIRVELYHTTKDGSTPDLRKCFSDEELQHITARYIDYPPSDGWPGHYMRASYKYSAAILDRFFEVDLPDIIYIKGLSGLKLLEEKARGREFPPVFLNVHGYEYYQKAPSFKALLQNFMLRPVFKRINTRADYIFSYGGRISDIIRERIGVIKDKIIEVPAAIERTFLVKGSLKTEGVRKFVFIGRFERRKGIEELFHTIKLVARDEKFIFHFIGPIPAESKLNLPFLVYHGQISSEGEIRQILNDCDVLVCPSYSEGMPNVILEGMAAGCAILASDVGAIPIQVNDLNGWLTVPGSVVQLREAMLTAIRTHQDELMEKKIQSQLKVEKCFLWDITIQQIIQAFQIAIARVKK